LNNITTIIPENIITNTIDPGIYRPKTLVLKTKSDYFESIKLLDFEPEIYLPNYISPDNPIIIFILYYIPEIIKQIIKSTNLNSC
jgi:hypothetical protein